MRRGGSSAAGQGAHLPQPCKRQKQANGSSKARRLSRPAPCHSCRLLCRETSTLCRWGGAPAECCRCQKLRDVASHAAHPFSIAWGRISQLATQGDGRAVLQPSCCNTCGAPMPHCCNLLQCFRAPAGPPSNRRELCGLVCEARQSPAAACAAKSGCHGCFLKKSGA